MMAKVPLCPSCAAQLRVVLAERGETAMARAIGDVLCETCRARVPGYVPGKRLVTYLKGAS